MRSETNKKIHKLNKQNNVHQKSQILNSVILLVSTPWWLCSVYVCACVVYLLFAELPDRQDVLAHQQVQQRRGLEVGHLCSRYLTP